MLSATISVSVTAMTPSNSDVVHAPDRRVVERLILHCRRDPPRRGEEVLERALGGRGGTKMGRRQRGRLVGCLR